MVSCAFWSQGKLLLSVGVVPVLLLECLATRSFPPGGQGDCRKEKQGGISSFEFRAKTRDVQIVVSSLSYSYLVYWGWERISPFRQTFFK